MTTRLLVLTLFAACTRGVPPVPPAPPPPAPEASTTVAAIGETFVVDSKILGERRVINVYLPPDYVSSATRYPVLYMPDGGMKEDFPHMDRRSARPLCRRCR